jgi:hypothetical protein
LHSHQQAHAVPVTARPVINLAGNFLPATQVEIANAEISPVGSINGLLQVWKKSKVDIIENTRHGNPFSSTPPNTVLEDENIAT